MTSELISSARSKRRSAKSNVTRCINSVRSMIEKDYASDELIEAKVRLLKLRDEAVICHNQYSEMLSDEDADKEEAWIVDLEDAINHCVHDIRVKVKEMTVSTLPLERFVQPSAYASQIVTLPQPEVPAQSSSLNSDSTDGPPPELPALSNSLNANHLGSGIRLEKAKLPSFDGSIRDYPTFKEEFGVHVNGNVPGSTAAMLLRGCLGPGPKATVRGLGLDYIEMWKELDANYGNPRLVSDAVLADIDRFRELKEGDDQRFIEYVNVIRAGYHVLKQVGRPGDMDNNAMLSRIEQKLAYDMKVEWSRHLEQLKVENPKVQDLLEWLETEKRTRIRTCAAVRNPSNPTVRNGPNARINQVAAAPDQRFNWFKCWSCQSNEHWLDQCQQFRDMSPDERLKRIKDAHACFSCLKKASAGHNLSSCRRQRQCTEMVNENQCTSFHHPLIHVPIINVAASTIRNSDNKILPVLTVDFFGRESSSEGNVLLDSGAEISIIRQDMADKLGLVGIDVVVNVTKVGCSEEQYKTKSYDVHVCSQVNPKNVMKINAISLPAISDDIKQIDLSELALALSLDPADLKRQCGKIDLLLGINYPSAHTGITKRSGDLVARKSILGWVVFGKTPNLSITACKVFHISRTEPVDLTEFWSTETLGTLVKPCSCSEDKMTRTERKESLIIKNSAIKIGNQWQIAYPWKKNPVNLLNNEEQVRSRLRTLERRLQKKESLREMYCEQMKQMETRGFARKLSKDEMEIYQGPVHYVSHHAVLKPDSQSTPVRIVFNASSTYQGHCLNDYWCKGPDLLNSLLGVLLRFREHPTAFIGDISKMFCQIRIPIKDQHVHRYLWRDMDMCSDPETYVLTTVAFGDRPSPAIACTALQLTAEENEKLYPEVASILKKNSYMDDICCSVDKSTDIEELVSNIDKVLQSGGFKTKGWISNDKRLDSENKNIVQKVLGIIWCLNTDTLKLSHVSSRLSESLTAKVSDLTKRRVLGITASIYDPLGFCTPVTVKAKVAIQDLWKIGIGWDEELPSESANKWMNLIDELKYLPEVRLERSLKPETAAFQPELIVFCDASQSAFGAVAYVRWRVEGTTEYNSRFAMAKSRVAPIKPALSIVRLELQAAVVAVRLADVLKEELSAEFSQTVFVTDSQIVKAMITRMDAKYKPFISVRVGEIQDRSEGDQWKCVPSRDNVADYLSRGVTISQLDTTWTNGPAFLELPITEWPCTEKKEINMPALLDESCSVNHIKSNVLLSAVVDENKFSNFRRLVRVTARVLQVCRRHPQLILTPSILKEAEDLWIMEAQRPLRLKFERNHFKSLTPYEENDIIRVGGRADRALMGFETKHPALLPYDSHISYLIAKMEHDRNHDGVATTADKIRRRFWIIRVHNLVKRIRNSCVTCRKFSAKITNQIMSELPEERLKPLTPPFYYTAVDLFGPFKVKVGRNKVDKHYGILLTCLNCRAIHLEMATDYSSQAFLAALRRFFSLRGYPAIMRSDRGTQLIGAERDLRDQLKNWDWNQIVDYGAERQMKWVFITPGAPHMNGVAESLVKSVKSCLKKVLGDTILRPMELYTVLLEVSNLVNERPIGRSTTDPNDWTTLCPNDLILGRASSRVPQGPFRESKNPRERLILVQHFVTSFWKRWTRDTFPSLVPRKKWQTERRVVRVDDVVIVADSNNVRGKWTIGKIEKVFPGKDGKVRNVAVKTSNGLYERPISKIVVICPAEDCAGPESGSA